MEGRNESVEYLSNIVKKTKPFFNIIIFLVVFTISFTIVIGTLKYTIPFIIGLIAASILKKPTEYLINRFNITGDLAAIVSTLIFYMITVTLLVLGVVFFCSEIKDLASDGYEYIYDNSAEINKLIQKSFAKFQNADPAIIETLKNNTTKFISDLSNSTLNFSKKIVDSIISVISALPYIISVIIFAILSSFVFLKKFIKSKYGKGESEKLKNKTYERYFKIIMEIKDVVFKYIGTYSILVFCTFIITFIGFSILGVPYTLLLSLTCMILDVLPVVGIILVFLPLMIIYFIGGKFFTVVLLGILLSVIMVTRNILEPKLLSTSLDISPLSVLISIFVGLNFAGFKGMIYLIALFISLNFYRKYLNDDIEIDENKDSNNPLKNNV